MERRTEELLKLKAYTEDIDKDLTMILQSLQWDRKHILEHSTMVSCKLDFNHRILAGKVEEHEKECLLRHNGYTVEDKFLPEPLDTAADTLIKLTKQDIMNTIDNAAKLDPTFKRGVGSGDMEPQTLARLQCAYSADERRAIHDAVVSAAPSCHDLTDLALPSGGDDERAPKEKSRTEILAELRDMRRRRTKYRVAAKSKNYSDVLRDVIKSQMELYNEVIGEVETKPDVNELNAVINKQTHSDANDNIYHRGGDRDRYEDRRDRRETDRDREPSKSERSDRNKRYGEYQSKDRRSRDDCSDRRYDRRNYSDHRPRELSKEVKVEIVDDNNDYRNRSVNKRHRDKYKERKYDEREDKRKERYAEGCSRDDDRKRRKQRDKSREKNDLDVERARNLIREIKREKESVERSQGDEDVSAYKEYVEVGSFRDYNRDDRRDRDGNNSRRHTNPDRSHSDRYRDRFDDRRSRDYKVHKERKDGRETKERFEFVDRHKESNKSEDNETKRSRTVDKHKRYYEIYSELDKRRNKESDDYGSV